MIVSPSEVLHLIVLHTLINISQHQVESLEDVVYPLFCFVAKTITLTSSHQYHCFGEFMESINPAVSSENLLDIIREKILGINCVDALLAFFDDCQTLFEPTTQLSPNDLSGPNKMCQNSTFGVFVRKLLGIWSNMLFDEQCRVFELFHDFKTDGGSCAAQQNKTDNITSRISSNVSNGAFCTAKDDIHQFFDVYSGRRIVDAAEGNVNATFLELQKHQALGNDCILKHQYGMISLALLWIKAGNFSMAQSAVEEALKTAHQRGDHPTVVKCLVLLYEICRGKSNDINLDLLKRCMAKSVELNLTELLTLSVTVFCQVKISLADESAPGPDTWTTKNLLSLLAFCEHGDANQTLSYCLERKVGCMEEALPSQQPMVNQKIPIINEKVSSLNSLYVQQLAHVVLLQSQLWQRANIPVMSDILCFKFLVYYGIFLDAEMLFIFFNNLSPISKTGDKNQLQFSKYIKRQVLQYYCPNE